MFQHDLNSIHEYELLPQALLEHESSCHAKSLTSGSHIQIFFEKKKKKITHRFYDSMSHPKRQDVDKRDVVIKICLVVIK
jgi:hypothetical protein